MNIDFWQWVFLGIAALSIGISKSGFSGISLISIYILTEIFGAVEQVGVGLPLLVLADIIVFPAFRKYGNWKEVWFLLPPTIIGGAAAFWILSGLNNGVMRPIVGGLIFLMVMMQLVRKWKPDGVYQLAMTKGFGVFVGVAGGLATVLANAAGPIQQLYLLSKKMQKMDLIGVGARFFLLVNLLKLPFLGTMSFVTKETLWINLCMAPAVVIGVIVGKKVLHKVPQKYFENLIVSFALLAAVRLIFW